MLAVVCNLTAVKIGKEGFGTVVVYVVA